MSYIWTRLAFSFYCVLLDKWSTVIIQVCYVGKRVLWYCCGAVAGRVNAYKSVTTRLMWPHHEPCSNSHANTSKHTVIPSAALKPFLKTAVDLLNSASNLGAFIIITVLFWFGDLHFSLHCQFCLDHSDFVSLTLSPFSRLPGQVAIFWHSSIFCMTTIYPSRPWVVLPPFWGYSDLFTTLLLFSLLHHLLIYHHCSSSFIYAAISPSWSSVFSSRCVWVHLWQAVLGQSWIQNVFVFFFVFFLCWPHSPSCVFFITCFIITQFPLLGIDLNKVPDLHNSLVCCHLVFPPPTNTPLLCSVGDFTSYLVGFTACPVVWCCSVYHMVLGLFCLQALFWRSYADKWCGRWIFLSSHKKTWKEYRIYITKINQTGLHRSSTWWNALSLRSP